MSETHTPGPWRLGTGNLGNGIEAFHGKESLHEGDDGFRTICTYQSCEPTGRFAEERANALANARLIAAAPELLEALKAILPFIPNTSASEGGASKYSENVRAADKVRAAIAKAQPSAKGV
jgi:hypothetical protein